MWDELLAAFGLMLVLEGVVPFLNPSALRRSLLQMAQLEDRPLRLVGLGSMLLGLAVLYFFR
jgi:uncharacterized protein YjeT (DUF2065 family)